MGYCTPGMGVSMQLLHIDHTRNVCLVLERSGNVYYVRRMTINEAQMLLIAGAVKRA